MQILPRYVHAEGRAKARLRAPNRVRRNAEIAARCGQGRGRWPFWITKAQAFHIFYADARIGTISVLPMLPDSKTPASNLKLLLGSFGLPCWSTNCRICKVAEVCVSEMDSEHIFRTLPKPEPPQPHYDIGELFRPWTGSVHKAL